MSDSPQSFVDLIESNCQQNHQAMAGSLNAALGTQYELIPQAATAGADAIKPLVPDEPGLAITIEVDGQGILCLIPQSLPIPDWYRSPDESQQEQLQTLATEWSANLVGTEVETSKTEAVACENLLQQFEAYGLPDDAQAMEVKLQTAPDTEADATLLLVWPLQTASAGVDEAATANESPVEQPASADEIPSPASSEMPAPQEQSPPAVRSPRLNRLSTVSVDLVVQLAGKSIDLRALRGLSPGTLITFDKTCDELLDVYVGNRLYCRGEAVKVGENFGIKINEVNSRVTRPGKVKQA